MKLKRYLSLATLILACGTVLVTCRKEVGLSERIAQKEESLFQVELKMFPHELMKQTTEELALKSHLPEYEEYIDSLYLTTMGLYNALVEINGLQEFKNHLKFLLRGGSLKKSGKTSFNDCDLALMGLGYGQGISVSASAKIGIALGLLKETEAKGEGGYKRVYDFVNLNRRYFHFTVCKNDPSYDWSRGLGVALKAGLGLTGT